MPGLPCGNSKTRDDCGNQDDCNWQPACCAWLGAGKGDDGKGWDCGSCCAECDCCNGDGCDACECCPYGRAFQEKHPHAGGTCVLSTCANHTQAQDCDGSDRCAWNATAATAGYCGEFSCK